MIAILALVLTEWVKVEPWPPEYLDARGEVELTANYSQLTGGESYKTLSNIQARSLVEKKRLNPFAWKLMVDVYLKNGSGVPLLNAIDTISRRNLTMKEFRQFNHCQRYAMNVIKGKLEFSKSLFGGRDWEDIRRKFPSFQGAGLSNLDALEDKNVCLAVMSNYALSPISDARTLADEARKKYPEYPFEYFYAMALGVDSYTQDSHGKLHSQTIPEPEKYLEQIKYLQKKWPTRGTPYFLLMQAYRGTNLKLSKQYASRYLALEAKPFRINWMNQAREILASH